MQVDGEFRINDLNLFHEARFPMYYVDNNI
jgi:hypothetical protein